MAYREKYLTRTESGVQARRKIRGQMHSKHFPNGTPDATIRAWLLTIELRQSSAPADTGTFAEDARRYLLVAKGMPTYAQRQQHIEEWIEAFGETMLTAEVTAVRIDQQLTAWATEPRQVKQRTAVGAVQRYRTIPQLSPAAVNKRRTALMAMFTRLFGKAAINPVDDVPLRTPPRPKAKGIAYDIIDTIFAQLPASKSAARLRVMAYTGIPQEQIRQIEPHDVDLVGATISLPGRDKGKGTDAVVLPLNAWAVEAFKMMAREHAWGAFTNTPLRRAFQRACLRALGHTRFTPYDLRHSFGTEVYRSTGDMRATQHLLQHASPQQSQRYSLGAVDARLVHAQTQFGKP